MKALIFTFLASAMSQELAFEELPQHLLDQLDLQKKGFASFVETGSGEPEYNILAMDGGGIRGIITAVVVDKMEK
jgi:uncharacterized protein YggL (DUF469 family)